MTKQQVRSYAMGVVKNEIANTTSIPFTHPITIVAAHTMSGARTITPNTTGALPGMGAIQRITADGTNIPDLSAFKKVNGSPAYININSVVNVLAFIYDGVDYRYAIVQDVADALTQLSTPVLVVGTETASTIPLSVTNILNNSGYRWELYSDAGFTTLLDTEDTAANVTSHTFTGLTSDTTYYVRVKALGNGTSYSDSEWDSDTAATAVDTMQYVDWIDELNTTDAGSGTLNGNNSTAGGARASKKISGDGSIGFTAAATLSNSYYLVLIFGATNSTDYTWNNAGNAVLGGIYFHGGGNIYRINTNTATATSIVAIGTYTRLKIDFVGNDAIYKASVDGSSWDTIYTQTGILSGVTDKFIRTSFAVNSATSSMVNVQGEGLVTI